MGTAVTQAFHVARAVIPHMRRQSAGRILMVASRQGVAPAAMQTPTNRGPNVKVCGADLPVRPCGTGLSRSCAPSQPRWPPFPSTEPNSP